MTSSFRIDGEWDVVQLASRTAAYPVTMMGWFRQSASRSGSYSGLFTIEYGAEHSTDYNELGIDESGYLVACDTNNYPLGSQITQITNGVWYKLAFVVTASRIKVYLGIEGTNGVTLVLNEAATNIPGPANYNGIGSSNYASSEWTNGCFAMVSVYKRELSKTELEAEFASETRIVHDSDSIVGAWFPPNINSDAPLTAIYGVDLIDGAGGGTPTYTVESGPTVDTIVGPKSLFVPGPSLREPGRQCSCLTSFRPRNVNRVRSLGGVLLGTSTAGALQSVASSEFFEAAQASGVVERYAVFSAASSLSAASGAIEARSAAIAATSSLSIAASGVAGSSVAISGSSALTMTACSVAASSVALSGSGALSCSPAFGSTAGTFCQGNDSRLSDDRTASGLRTASTVVSVSSATAPTSGQVLTATSGTAATWQTPATGGVPTTRTLTAGTGLTGGGDLSADRTFNVVANADGSIVANADNIQVGVLATDAQHGTRGGGTLHATATTSATGFMSATDKTKVDSITLVGKLTVASTAPTNPSVGDIWIDIS